MRTVKRYLWDLYGQNCNYVARFNFRDDKLYIVLRCLEGTVNKKIILTVETSTNIKQIIEDAYSIEKRDDIKTFLKEFARDIMDVIDFDIDFMSITNFYIWYKGGDPIKEVDRIMKHLEDIDVHLGLLEDKLRSLKNLNFRIDVVPTNYWIRIYITEKNDDSYDRTFTLELPDNLSKYLIEHDYDDEDYYWNKVCSLCEDLPSFIDYDDWYRDYYGWGYRVIVETSINEDNFDDLIDDIENFKDYLHRELNNLNNELISELRFGNEIIEVNWDFELFKDIEVKTPILKHIKKKIVNAINDSIPDEIETIGFEPKPYDNSDFYVEGIKFGIEIEGNIEDLAKLAGFWDKLSIEWESCHDGSLPDSTEYAELKIHGTTSFENIVKTILFVKQNFRDFNSTCGIHVTINTGDVIHRSVEYRRIWLIKVMNKARRKHGHGVTYLRDRNSYSHWKHDYYSHYQVLRSKDNCVEYRAMGLPYLKSLNEKKLFYYLASIYALAIFLRSRWVTKEWWKVMKKYLKDDKPDTIFNAILFNEF